MENSWYGECNRSEPSSETSAEAREQNSHAHAHTQPQGKEKYSFVLMNPLSSLYLNSSSTGTQTVNEFSTVFQSERMIGQLLSSNQENNVYESQPMAGHCWWRSAAKFDECANLGIQNLSKVTPRAQSLEGNGETGLGCPRRPRRASSKAFQLPLWGFLGPHWWN